METVTFQVMTRLAALALSAMMAFQGIEVGDTIPNLDLKTVDGKKFDSGKQLDGKSVVLTFWRLGQPYSERLLEDLKTLHGEFSKDGLEIVAINSGETDPAEVKAVAKRLKLEFPMLLDPDREVYGKFGVFVAPATGFVDEKGALRFYYASHRRDFLSKARANVALLLGKVSAKEHEERTETKGSWTPKLKASDPQYKLAIQLLERGNIQGAKDLLRKAWEGEAKSARAGRELAYILLGEDKAKDALELFMKLADQDPKNSNLVGGKGIALMRTGKEKEGKKILEDAFKLGPRDPKLLYEIGRWFEEQGNAEEALNYFKQGLERSLKK